MTARCARMRDETFKFKQAVRPWYQRVNIRGERIALPVDGPLEQTAWMKERIARAKQALPNGYCELPLVQSCAHPNACLSCESFLTDGSFRAVHEQQQAELRREIEALRTAQTAAPARLPVRQRAGDASLRARLRAALDESRLQREEIGRRRVRELELNRPVRRR